MPQEPVVIPDKIYFKIGEVCELVGVQAHVLRYWESEFPMLSPQKNNSGQRSYRRKDVEIALRIKQLLYNEMFTIAGARKKLQSDSRDGTRTKSSQKSIIEPRIMAPTLFDTAPEPARANDHEKGNGISAVNAGTVNAVRAHLLELRDILRNPPASRVD